MKFIEQICGAPAREVCLRVFDSKLFSFDEEATDMASVIALFVRSTLILSWSLSRSLSRPRIYTCLACMIFVSRDSLEIPMIFNPSFFPAIFFFG